MVTGVVAGSDPKVPREWGMWLAGGKRRDHGNPAVDALLRELDELRELDRQRQTHAPGSPDHERASREFRSLTARLMDHARDLDGDPPAKPAPSKPAPGNSAPAEHVRPEHDGSPLT